MKKETKKISNLRGLINSCKVTKQIERDKRVEKTLKTTILNTHLVISHSIYNSCEVCINLKEYAYPKHLKYCKHHPNINIHEDDTTKLICTKKFQKK